MPIEGSLVTVNQAHNNKKLLYRPKHGHFYPNQFHPLEDLARGLCLIVRPLSLVALCQTSDAKALLFRTGLET